jgi:hypothetical protein
VRYIIGLLTLIFLTSCSAAVGNVFSNVITFDDSFMYITAAPTLDVTQENNEFAAMLLSNSFVTSVSHTSTTFYFISGEYQCMCRAIVHVNPGENTEENALLIFSQTKALFESVPQFGLTLIEETHLTNYYFTPEDGWKVGSTQTINN